MNFTQWCMGKVDSLRGVPPVLKDKLYEVECERTNVHCAWIRARNEEEARQKMLGLPSVVRVLHVAEMEDD